MSFHLSSVGRKGLSDLIHCDLREKADVILASGREIAENFWGTWGADGQCWKLRRGRLGKSPYWI
jgi:hypothetical protein